LALGDVSNTSSTIITSPKCKIISVIDVSSSDGSSNYGSSLSISTLTISTKVRMPPSSMKGKRESNENASNMSDLDTSSEEEDSLCEPCACQEISHSGGVYPPDGAELPKTVRSRLKTQYRERLRRREAKRKEETVRRTCSVSPIAGLPLPPFSSVRPPTPFPKRNLDHQIQHQVAQENNRPQQPPQHQRSSGGSVRAVC